MIVQLMFDASDPEAVLHAELSAAPRAGEMVVAGSRCFVVRHVVWHVADEGRPSSCVALVAESDIAFTNAFSLGTSNSLAVRRPSDTTEH